MIRRRAASRDGAHRLRRAVEALPRRTREAMLRGVDSNRIIVGAYVDPRSGGVCPMLAAHRNGGRTSVASFARAWDAYTGARRPRRATRREVATLRAILADSLELDVSVDRASISELAAQIRAEREQLAACAAPPANPQPAPGEPTIADEATGAGATGEPTGVDEPAIRIRRRRRDPAVDLLALAEQALAEQGRWERTGQRPTPSPAR